MKLLKYLLTTMLVSASIVVSQAAPRSFFRRTLSSDAKEALVQALAGPHGEYAAHAQYVAILGKFGADVQPYASISAAEARHVAALQRQLEKFGIDLPTNTFEGTISAPDSLETAAKNAITSEQQNISMYNEALKAVADYPDLVRVFTNLRNASRDAHLPALQVALEPSGRAATRSTGCRGMGRCLQGGHRSPE